MEKECFARLSIWALRLLRHRTAYLEPLEDDVNFLCRERICRCFFVGERRDQCRNQDVKYPLPEPRHEVELDLVRQGDGKGRELQYLKPLQLAMLEDGSPMHHSR